MDIQVAQSKRPLQLSSVTSTRGHKVVSHPGTDVSLLQLPSQSGVSSAQVRRCDDLHNLGPSMQKSNFAEGFNYCRY